MPEEKTPNSKEYTEDWGQWRIHVRQDVKTKRWTCRIYIKWDTDKFHYPASEEVEGDFGFRGEALEAGKNAVKRREQEQKGGEQKP